jgi:hypothetical protein
MFDDIDNNPEWEHLHLDEYRDYASLYDMCPCSTAFLGLYRKKGSKEFLVRCSHCNTYIHAENYVDAMIGWNKKCRHLRGQI